RLHLDDGVLPAGDESGPLLHRDCLQVGQQDDIVNARQRRLPNGGLDERVHVLSVRLGQEQGGALLHRQPRRQGRQGGSFVSTVRGIGDDDRSHGPKLQKV